jgi:3-phosphoshikimate 1-carboxyvinyltransferase
MAVTIKPSSIQGNLTAPPGKSSMQRACAAALLHHGSTTLYNAGNSNDDLAALDVIQKLGAIVNNNPDGSITINSKGVQPIATDINCGESGLGIRMFAPIAALSNQALVLTGKGSLPTRPMNFFDEIFPALGIQIQSNNGKLPLTIQGPLVPANITVDGSLSSQFITGLLMAYSAANVEATITVNNLTSKPYIDLTLDVLKAFGLQVPVKNDYQSFSFLPTKSPSPEHINYTVEGDWSSASFLLVSAAIAGNISLKGLNVNSSQADKAIIDALSLAGCKPDINENEVTISATNLNAFEFDATDCPDLFPPLVALAAYCKGTSTIHGVNRLQHKESNRGITLKEEFGKMGIEIQLHNDEMYITGNEVTGATINPHNDHRIAMACAVAGLRAKGNTIIDNPEVVNKSYPGYFTDLQKLQVIQ